jgi:hypothetical protein
MFPRVQNGDNFIALLHASAMELVLFRCRNVGQCRVRTASHPACELFLRHFIGSRQVGELNTRDN